MSLLSFLCLLLLLVFVIVAGTVIVVVNHIVVFICAHCRAVSSSRARCASANTSKPVIMRYSMEMVDVAVVVLVFAIVCSCFKCFLPLLLTV